MFVGEIGIPRREFLYDIQFWEARRILDGYNARHRNLWSAVRWQTYKLMEAQGGTEHLRKNGINSPADLIQFPWDREPTPTLTDEERKEMQAEMDAENASIRENKKDESQ